MIIRILYNIDIIRNRGSGMAIMIIGMRELHLDTPIFENKR